MYHCLSITQNFKERSWCQIKDSGDKNINEKEQNSRNNKILGYPFPILPLLIGDELTCRIMTRLILDEGIHCNGIECPIVKMGQARLRVNLQPQHTKDQMDTLIETFDFCFKKAIEMIKQYIIETKITQDSLERYQPYFEKQEQRQSKNNQSKVNFNETKMELKKPNL